MVECKHSENSQCTPYNLWDDMRLMGHIGRKHRKGKSSVTELVMSVALSHRSSVSVFYLQATVISQHINFSIQFILN